MSEIKVEVSSETVDIKVKKDSTITEINHLNKTIINHYDLVKYMVVEGEEVVLSREQGGSYPADYEVWLANEVGVAVKAAMLAELAKEVPGTPAV